MLEGLNDVDWQGISDAFGPASGVPGFLRDLASPDADVRASALGNLTNHIWHQTTLFEATEFAVAFLVQLLAEAEVQDKHLILGLLWGIAGMGAPSVYPPFSDQASNPPAPDRRAGNAYSAAHKGSPPT